MHTTTGIFIYCEEINQDYLMLTIESLQFLAIGSFFGLAAGISPGALLTLVITQTIRYNKTEGIKVAISPLVTDLPIILLTFLVLGKLSQFNSVLGAISFAGAIFIAYLGYESITFKGLYLETQDSNPNSLKKGVIANFLNPHPYLFWVTVGTPYIFKALSINLFSVIIFITSFYLLLIGSKIAIALIVNRSKAFVRQKAYVFVMKFLGLALFVFSLLFIYEGLKYLNAI